MTTTERRNTERRIAQLQTEESHETRVAARKELRRMIHVLLVRLAAG